MTAQDINKHLYRGFSNFDYKLFNVYVFDNESDFLAVSKSGYVWEVEVKVSISDFKNDFTKTDWGGKNKHDQLQSDKITFKPNKFCFAVPEGLITVNELPDYAGLIYVSEIGIKIIKQPKFLHKEKLFKNNFFLKQMMNKFYYRHLDLVNELQLRQWDIKYKQRRIEFI